MGKSFTPEHAVQLLAQIEEDRLAGHPVFKACRTAGVSDTTYYAWRKRYGGSLKRNTAHEMRRTQPDGKPYS
ncbi:MAG: transposase [Pseudomonadota bacterium]